MILYYFEHPSQLFKILIHKLYFHRNDEAVLMVADYSYQFEPVVNLREHYMKELKITQMFPFPHAFNWIGASSNEEYQNKILSIYNEHFKKYNIDIGRFEKIYISRDSGVGFELYCMINAFKYTYIETIKNNAIKHIGNGTKGTIYGFYDHMLLKEESKAVFNEVTTMLIETEHNDRITKWEYFDFSKVFESFEAPIKNIFFNIFPIRQIPIIDDCYLFFPNSTYYIYSALNMPMNSVYLSNELLADYYFNNVNLMLKPHPLFDFDLESQNRVIPKISYIIPSEMLRFVPNLKIKKAIFVISSSVDDMTGFADEIVFLGWTFNAFFVSLHSWFVISKLIEHITENEKYYGEQIEIGYNGLYGDQLGSFQKYALKDTKIKGFACKPLNELAAYKAIILFLERTEDQSRLSEEICNFLNSLPVNTVVGFVIKDNYIPFLSYKYKNLKDHIVPVTIRKTATKENIHSDLDNEYVFIFCKNKKIREKIFEFKLEKNLEFTGIKINADMPKGAENQIVDMLFNLGYLEDENRSLSQMVQRQQEKQNNILKEITKLLST